MVWKIMKEGRVLKGVRRERRWGGGG